MIKSIRIKGFQSHKDTELELHKGTNAIIGTSGSGKSSIIRALKWVILNEPRGVDFVSWWDDINKTTVSILLENGTTVTRTRSKALNQYQINKEEPLKALRTGVPDEIETTLRMNEFNIQEQHNPYFLLQDKSSVVATQFNEIAKLQVMESCSREAKSLVRRIKQELADTSVEIENTQQAITDLEWLDEAEKEVQKLADLEDRIRSIQDTIIAVNALYFEYETTQQKIAKTSEILLLENDVIAATELAISIREKQNNIQKIVDLLEAYQEIDNQIVNIDIQGLIENTNETLVLVEQHSILRKKIKNLTELLTEYDNISMSLDNSEKQIKELQKTFDTTMKELGVCPLCDNKI